MTLPSHETAATESLRAALHALAEQLGGGGARLEQQRVRLAVNRYVRAAAGAGLSLEEAGTTAAALVRSLASAQRWAPESAEAVTARLVALIAPAYAVEVVMAGGR